MRTKLIFLAACLYAMPAFAAPASGSKQDWSSYPPGTSAGNPLAWAGPIVPYSDAYAATAHLAVLKSANMNITTDQPMVMFVYNMPTYYAVTSIYATNCSATPAGAVGGLYTAASKGGTAIVAATQTYTALTSAAAIQQLTNAVSTSRQSATQLYFSLTTASGTTETCDIYLDGIGLQ